jgi:hypothetical protein
LDHGSKTPRRLALELGAASFIVLFQELTLIRWLPGQIRVLAYFPNLILLSAFLGLGLGCLRAGGRPLLRAWLPALVVMAAAALALSRIVFTQDSAAEHLYLLYYDLPPGAPVVHDVRVPIIIFFILSVGSFVPLGQAVAERLEEFRRRSIPLSGYCWDILGSLGGVVAFAAVCFAGAFPVAWFAVFLAAGFVLFAHGRRPRLVYLAAAALVLGLVARAERAEQYSPYYALQVVRAPDQPAVLQVLANGGLVQYVLPLNRNDPANEVLRLVRDGYHLPYRFMGAAPRRALVVGAAPGMTSRSSSMRERSGSTP